MKFEKVSRFADSDISLPVRKTAGAAGYDFEVAEEIIVPPYMSMVEYLGQVIVNNEMQEQNITEPDQQISVAPYDLAKLGGLTKITGIKPTLVSTGVKCQLDKDKYLELSVRSSCPLKYWLVLANSVGIIDSDYYNNPDNEGEIFFQLINFSPVPIVLHKGDVIGQGIIKSYYTTEDDNSTAERVGGFGSTDGR